MVSAFIFVGCSKSSGGETPTKYQMKMNIDGVPYSTSAVHSTFSGGSLSINGRTDSNQYEGLTIHILYYEGQTGTFTFTDHMNSHVKAQFSVKWDSPNVDHHFAMEMGSVTITEVTNKDIKGTFSMVVKNLESGETKTLTEGSFYTPLAR